MSRGGKDGIKDGLGVNFVFLRWNLLFCDLILKKEVEEEGLRKLLNT